MISTGDAALLDPAVEERSAAMGAVIAQQPHTPTFVLEEHQVFAQEANELGGRLVGEVL
jgi:hypothetical protein